MFKIILRKRYNMQLKSVLKMIYKLTRQKKIMDDLKKENTFLIDQLDKSNRKFKKVYKIAEKEIIKGFKIQEKMKLQ